MKRFGDSRPVLRVSNFAKVTEKPFSEHLSENSTGALAPGALANAYLAIKLCTNNSSIAITCLFSRCSLHCFTFCFLFSSQTYFCSDCIFFCAGSLSRPANHSGYDFSWAANFCQRMHLEIWPGGCRKNEVTFSTL